MKARGIGETAPALTAGAETDVFVGREHELRALRAALAEALQDRGRLVLIPGEPGIGKSRLADEIALEANAAGATVAWGRCWEAGGAPAYWPWVQPLRSLLRRLPQEKLESHLGGGGSPLAEILPELRQLLRGLPPAPSVDPETARFRLFEAVSGFLRSSARAEPLVIVLDDLHVADTPSLLLLQFLAGQLQDAPILLTCAYRETELTEDHPLAATLAELLRHPDTRRLPLGGLSEQEVASFIDLTAGVAPPAGVAAKVHAETEGNPLFVGEVVRLLAEEGLLERPAAIWDVGVPQGVRQVIARRLSGLSEEAIRVLTPAAVLGREFDVAALETLTGRPRDELLETLDEAISAKIVIEAPGALGRLRFSHALVRDTLYDELSVARRVKLHREAGAALERRYEGDLEPHLAELAHHFSHAAAGGEVEKAVDYARRAGVRAVRLMAYEEAVRLFELALATLELQPVIEPRRRCELALGLGDAQARAGDGAASKETFLRAAAVARGIPAANLLARAALGYGGRFLWARAGSDPALVPLLEEALAALGAEAGPLRVQVMSRLAGALRDRHDREPRERLSRQAVEIARRLGDPHTLAYALDGRFAAIMWPENPDERLSVAGELLELAEAVGDRERAVQARYYRAGMTMLELGDIAGVEEELRVIEAAADELRQPAQRWIVAATWATLALFEGRFGDAEELMQEALELGVGAQASDAVLSDTVQLFTLGMLRDGLESMESRLRRSIVDYPARPMFRCMLAYLLAETGREPEAAAVLEALAEHRFAALPMTNEWLFSLGFLADTARALGDAERADVLYELMLPYAARNACTADYIATGSASRPIGVAAATGSRWEEAERHFEEAVRANARMGARPWAALSAYDWAWMLLRRDAPGDRERAAELRDRALLAAHELGMKPLERRATALTGLPQGRGRPAGTTPAVPSVFRREGEYWAVAYEGDPFRLKDSKGLRYIAHLLAAPGREVHALELVAAERGGVRAEPFAEVGPTASRGGDSGEILDAQARAAYRRRLAELEEELEEARRFGDPERAAALESERDALVREIAAAFGLQRRPRRTGSPAERARVSVTRAIRAAIPRICEHSPELGEHLERTIHTGRFCSYTPDPRALVDWRL
jgi:tetratricopeptide (TPR) repeat protein